MLLRMALHSCMCQIYPLTHTPLLKMMVYFFYLQLVLWFIIKPHVGDVGEMNDMMGTTQLDFFLEIHIFPFGAFAVCFDL